MTTRRMLGGSTSPRERLPAEIRGPCRETDHTAGGGGGFDAFADDHGAVCCRVRQPDGTAPNRAKAGTVWHDTRLAAAILRQLGAMHGHHAAVCGGHKRHHGGQGAAFGVRRVTAEAEHGGGCKPRQATGSKIGIGESADGGQAAFREAEGGTLAAAASRGSRWRVAGLR